MVKRGIALSVVLAGLLALVLLGYFYTKTTTSSVDTVSQSALTSLEEVVVPYDDRYVMQVDDEVFFVSIAADAAERRQGLSGTAPLREREGKLFIFPQSDRYGFWMKDMNYPIDILWFNAMGVLVHTEVEVQPDTYPTTFTPNVPARYVLEVAAGEASRLGLAVGDTLRLSESITQCVRYGCNSK